MRYLVVFKKGCILTDDYDKSEVKANIHIKHIKRDLKTCDIRCATVYDENQKFVCRLTR